MRDEAIAELARAAYKLSAADARLRGRSTRSKEALAFTHARALRSLAEYGPMTVNKLAEHVETTGAAVTQLVNGLSGAGYVTRERTASGDRRTSIVALTDKGLQRHEEGNRILTAALREVTDDLDYASIETVSTVIARLASLYDRL